MLDPEFLTGNTENTVLGIRISLPRVPCVPREKSDSSPASLFPFHSDRSGNTILDACIPPSWIVITGAGTTGVRSRSR
jgi:hypothetical protein